MSDVFAWQDIKFWGSVYTTHFAVPHLRESRGKIIVLASSSWLPKPRMSFYNVSNIICGSL
jgi:NAD(P)-dependent dehydrogenase (short-subunit alcohol dehydrogenase family)